MTKKEFEKIEAAKGFDYALMEFIADYDFKNGDYFWHKTQLLQFIYEELLKNKNYDKAIYFINIIKNNDAYSDWLFDGWDENSTPCPIKSIKDIEEFLDDEGGAENEI